MQPEPIVVGSYARHAVEALRTRLFEPEGYTLSAVAAVEVWAEAVRRTGTLDAHAVAAALKAGEFSTSYGPIALDSKGDVVSPLYAVHEWSNGQYSIVS
jgi:branched-chain amino acid transport system substrate-binding protein